MRKKHKILGKIVEYERPFIFHIHNGYIHFETKTHVGMCNIHRPDFWDWMELNGFTISEA